ncbi:putative tRNA/rRNA methyltransferase [Candidatus Moduliflexus flocculans]|uniref:Putative tRNA/rRNA methyltransferase n=1 Tax=Candidatus Moduliflexus flocculans TaxID=1499966 RepID=A0A081BRC2_9BACT|nr:putative tRNA/rRNA methyltransferase [Candidatus Moduliflexus flocculans]
MIFTLKKFRLIGQRARIKKLFHLLIDLIPTFKTPADLETLPLYLDYLITLNAETTAFKFTEQELGQLTQFQQALTRWIPEDASTRRRPFSEEEKRHIGRTLIELRYLFAEKIQQPIREASLIILERDVPPKEALVWPQEIVVVFDHLRSPFNVGAVIRTMECVGLHRVISVGYTPRLDSRQVQRSAMGCDTAMNAEYVDDGVETVKRLKEHGYQIHVLETIIPSTSVFELQPLVQQRQPIAFVIGNEEMGVDESIVALADHLLHIPTFGAKNSLNVSIAFSIAIYQYWQAVFC